MAAIIQLRRGSSPSSLSYGEPFINDDSASLVIGLSGSGDIITLAKLEQKNHGNIWIDGDITASSISASGDIRIGGQLFLGDEASDNIVVQGSLSSSLIPEADGTYDLGSSTKKWKDIHVGTIFATSTVVTGQANISGSAQITAFGFISGSDLNSLNSYTASNDVAIGLINTHTASANIKFTNIESTTSSFDGRLDNIEAATGSYINTATLNSLGVISGSSQVDADSVTNFDNNVDTRIDAKGVLSGSAQVVSSFPTGVISGSSQVNANSVTNFDTNVDTRLDAKTVISGSSQVDGTAISNNSITISGTAVSLGGTITDEVLFGGVGVLSGSGQIPAVLPTGVISGSSQVDAATVSNFDSNVDDRLNAKTVVSGSSQVVGILNEVNTFTSSNDNTSLNSFTSSFDTAITLDSSNVTVLGNLTVQGTQTALDTNTLNVADLNILVASGAADSSAANGAGLTVDGANKSIVWNHADQNFRFNTDVSASVFKGDGSGLTGLTADSVAYANITGLPTLVSGSGQTLAHITGSDLDMNGNKVLFANVYAAEGDLPSAVTYHGMFAHVHATGRGYFAHAGAWIPLVNLSDGVFSGSSQVNADSVTNFDANVDTRLDAKTVISGSSQVDGTAITNKSFTISGTSVSLGGTITDEVLFGGTGVISGSAQIDHDATDNYVAGEHFLQSAITTVGTIGTGVWEGTAIDKQYLDDEVLNTSLNSFTASNSNTSLNSYTASNDTTNTTQTDRLDQLSTSTGSINTRLDQFATHTGSLGTAAFFNVTSSIFGDSTVVPTAAAVNDAIVSSGGGDITAVGAGLGLSGGGVSGDVTLNLDTGSTHFTTAVTALGGGSVNNSNVTLTAGAGLDGGGTFTLNQGGAANITFTVSDGVVSGSSQIDVASTTNYGSINQYSDSKVKLKLDADGVISGSSQVNADSVTNFDTNVDARIDSKGVISGSSQVDADSITNFDTNVKAKLDADTVISGSSQVNANNITNFDANVDTRLDAKTVISGSSQVNANSITNFDANVDTRLDAKTVISGSSQVSLSGFSTTNLSEGTNKYYTDARVKTKLDAETVISGSSQVNADSITNFDTNVDTRLDTKTVISGSSQVNADSVTNFDSNVDTRLDAKTVISGSSQVVLDDADKTGFNTDEVTEGSTNKYATTTNVKTALNANLGTATIGDSDDTITIPGNLNVGGETNYTSTNNITIGDNIIELNYGGSATTSGILTKDATGGSTISGSLLWDATNDYWKAGKLGSESELITDGTLVSKLPDGLVSGSSQVDATAVANFDANVDTRLDAKTVISGSSQVNYNQILNQPNTISNAQSTKLGYITVSQAVDLDTMESNITTNNSKVGYTDALVKLKLDADGVISGSSQVNANSITNFDTNVDTRLDAKTVISGSSQVNANSITNFDANVDTRLDAKTVISGSSQVDGASITNKSVSFGGVSVNLGSSDATPAFDLSDATAYPGDSSLTTLGTVTSGNVTAILPTGVISGSSQQTFESSSFAETASLAIHTAEWILGASGASHYTFTGPGHLTGSSDPAIYLTRGQKYRFTNKAGSHPFRIQSTANGSAGTQYNNGVTNQDAGNNETLEFDVPMNAPNTLYYQCTIHGSMGGPIYIADAADYLTAESDTLATVTGRGATTSTAIEFSNTTNSTSKTTGAVKIGGGLGVADNINAGGDIVAYASSDERLKDNIKPIEGALDKVSQISGNTFDWNEEKQNIYKGKDYGVIAQEIEKVMPELVDTRDDGYKAVKYEKIVPLLIESIKELQKEINELKSK